MTRFESIGVERQSDALDKAEANREFENSCTICCNHGIHIDCDRCAISFRHAEVIDAFNSFEQIKREMSFAPVLA